MLNCLAAELYSGADPAFSAKYNDGSLKHWSLLEAIRCLIYNAKIIGNTIYSYISHFRKVTNRSSVRIFEAGDVVDVTT